MAQKKRTTKKKKKKSKWSWTKFALWAVVGLAVVGTLVLTYFYYQLLFSWLIVAITALVATAILLKSTCSKCEIPDIDGYV